MNIEAFLKDQLLNTLDQLYGKGKIDPGQLVLQKTKKEFTGDFTLVCFGLARVSGKNPGQTAGEIGQALQSALPEVSDYNVVNGFLNISFSFAFWTTYFIDYRPEVSNADSGKVMIEYSSPNTNKPLHLGHIRNNLLGFSVSRILQATGKHVSKVNLVNDRGVHICKSMLAWQRSGLNETPASSGMKGDHLVGKYYVEFDKALKTEADVLLREVEAGNFDSLDEDAREPVRQLRQKLEEQTDAAKRKELQGDLKLLVNAQTGLMKRTQEMLRKWEDGDPEVMSLWKTMNGWVYEGFDETYRRLGVDFDRIYYESDTYLLGKEIVQQGLDKGILYRKEDGSVWIDLTAEGLDHKLLLRSDGTSVYMTQDLGTAVLRHNQLMCDQYIYVVGNEQDYHFKALALILQKLGYSWATGIYHLSYGMVDLPEGKMKSREGTVVDADELMDEVIAESRKLSEELGKTDEMGEEERENLYRVLGLGALNYFILKVDPRKRMVFNPTESIDLKGNTGPFIQYSYARIQSLKARTQGIIPVSFESAPLADEPQHRALIRLLAEYEETVGLAASTLSPAVIANYAFELAKQYNQFYQEFSILKEPDRNLAAFRLALAGQTGDTLKQAMYLLGIEMPERM